MKYVLYFYKKIIDIEIPKELDKFLLDFSKRKDNINFGEYFSDSKNFNISYYEKNEKCRISNKTKRIELPPEIKEMTQDLVYFICMQMYLLKDNTLLLLPYDEIYIEADLIAMGKCKEHKMDTKKLIKDIINFLKSAPSELNTKRIENLVQWQKENGKK